MCLLRYSEYEGLKSRLMGVALPLITDSMPTLEMVEVLPLKRSWKSIRRGVRWGKWGKVKNKLMNYRD